MRIEEINKWINEGGSLPQDLTQEEKEHLTKLGWSPGQGWHNNGQKKFEYNWLHGKQHGIYRGWYENGQKYYERHFLHGQHHGKWEGWRRNGQKSYEYHYFHGMNHGVFKEWDADGNLDKDEECLYGNKIK